MVLAMSTWQLWSWGPGRQVHLPWLVKRSGQYQPITDTSIMVYWSKIREKNEAGLKEEDLLDPSDTLATNSRVI